jgi:SNF2 family DNA or RNA helicase
MSILDFQAQEWVPKLYQVGGVNWLLTHPESALCLWPGLGKTTTTLEFYCRLKAYGYNFRMLVVAPLRVAQTTWMAEPKKWRNFQHLRVGLAHGVDKEEILLNKRYDIVVINYDAIPWLTTMLEKHKELFQIVVFDELTKMKHINTKRFKLLKPYLAQFSYRIGLTGTPAANGLQDLFGQVYTLDLGQRLGKYKTHFLAKFFHQKPWDEYKWYIVPEKEAALHRKLEDLFYYVDPKEALQLPDEINISIPVTLPPKALEAYRQMQLLSILRLEGKTLIAANAGVVTGKLRQMTGGAVYTSDREYEVIHTAKLDALNDLIEELAGEPAMVAYQYDHELERLKEEYPEALVVSGGMSDKQMQKILQEWSTGMHPVMLTQCDAAAYGLNLQDGGNVLIWFTQTYNLEINIQLFKRLHRQGQKKIVRVYHIMAQGTIDEYVVEALAAKNVTQEKLFAHLQQKLLQIVTTK